MKKVPAMAAVSRHANVAAIRALRATAAMLAVFSRANALIPPTKIAIEAKWAKPHRA